MTARQTLPMVGPDEMNGPVTVTLKDGTGALLRPVIQEDKWRIAKGLAQMSPQSRYLRFFTSTAKLTEEQLRYFTEVDQEDHVAWIAVDPTAPQQDGLGIARFIRTTENPRVAEMAFTVIDDRQHNGLGTYLLGVLYLMAQARGVEVLRAIVLPENHRVTEWIRRLGGKSVFGPGLDQMDLPVARELSLMSTSPETCQFRRVLEDLEAGLRG